MSYEIQNKLRKYGLILRKYQLLNKEEFFSEFSNFKTEYLKIAWEYSFEKIQNKEIIKNASKLPKFGNEEIVNRLKKFNYNSEDLFYYLNSSFDVKELKLDEERIERRIRNILAKRHQEILKNEIKLLKKTDKRNQIKERFLSGIATAFIPLVIVGFLFGSKIRDGFTSVDVLTERIYSRSVYKFSGSICRDGTTSDSQGRGTCSWHGGVSYKFYKGQHKKTKNECRIEAKEKSWIE